MTTFVLEKNGVNMSLGSNFFGVFFFKKSKKI